MPIFGATQLQDIIVEACKAKDFRTATGLLDIAAEAKLEVSDLAAYATGEALGELPKAMGILEAMAARGATIPEHAAGQIFERICQTASEPLMDRFLALPLKASQEQLESAISFVFLRSLRFDRVIELIKVARKRGMRVHATVWQEVFEVLLQPSSTQRSTLAEAAMRASDRRFDKLVWFLKQLQESDVALDTTAVTALETVVSASVVPIKFLRFLEQYHEQREQKPISV
jgi:hypothetical protein